MSRMIIKREPIYENIKACVFDFDGTLVNTMGEFGEIAADIMSKNYDISYEEAKASYFFTSGNPFEQQLEELFPGNPYNEKAVNEFENRKLEGFFNTEFPISSRVTVNTLQKKGIKVAVSSNNFQSNITSFLKKKNIKFDYALGFKEGFSKGKDHFDYLKEIINIKADEILFVGDSLKDAEKAKENKVNFIARTGIFTKKDFYNKYPEYKTVKDLSEIIDLIG